MSGQALGLITCLDTSLSPNPSHPRPRPSVPAPAPSRARTFRSPGPLGSARATSIPSVHSSPTPGGSAACWEIYGRGSSTLIRTPVVESHTAHGFCFYFCCRGRLSRAVGVQGISLDSRPCATVLGVPRDRLSFPAPPLPTPPRPLPQNPRNQPTLPRLCHNQKKDTPATTLSRHGLRPQTVQHGLNLSGS